MRRPPIRPDARAQERGIALAIVLVVMTVLTLFGVMILMQTDTNLIISRHERDVATCRAAAEAAARQGIQDAMTRLDRVTGFDAVLACSGTPTCPPPNPNAATNYLSTKYIVDWPGFPFNNAWQNRLYIDPTGTVANPSRGRVYVTYYGRNNNTEATMNDDRDQQVVVVGEAVMTVDGSPPLVDRSNIRVRKLIAAEIRPPRTSSGTGGAHSGGNTGTGYGG